MKGKIKRREMVGEKDSQRRRMALNETTETVRLSGRSRCAISPPVWREPHRAKRDLRGSIDRRKEAKWKRQTFLSIIFLYNTPKRCTNKTRMDARQWSDLYAQACSRLQPGDWNEHMVPSAIYPCYDGSLPADSLFADWGQKFDRMGAKGARPFNTFDTMNRDKKQRDPRMCRRRSGRGHVTRFIRMRGG